MPDQLRALTENVWIFPHRTAPGIIEPAVGVISTATQTVLVDAGNSPAHARRILNAIMAEGLPPVSHVIYTHFHWDHTFGGASWGGPCIAHRLCPRLLHEVYASRPWSRDYIDHQIAEKPARAGWLLALDELVGDWSRFRFRLPTITFADQMTLRLSGLTLDLRHVGGEHAADSITVTVRERGVMFMGDCFYPRPDDPTAQPDLVMLAGLLDDSIHTYVAAHHAPATRAAYDLLAHSRR